MFDFAAKKKSKFAAMKNQGGFLMIELIVALFIFGIVMTVSIGSLLTALDSNRKTLALKSVLNNLEIATDTLTKTISAGRYYQCAEGVESGFVFTNQSDPGWCNTESSTGHTAISLVSNENLDDDVATKDAVVYRLQPAESNHPGFIERKRYKSTDGGTFWSETDDEWVRMTAPEVNITDLKFYITGTEPIENGDYKQPKVLVVIAGEVSANDRVGATKFNVQTLVTQLIPDF